MADMTLDEAVKWLRNHVGDLRSAAQVLRESPWGAKLAATATEVDKAADEGTLAIAALETAQEDARKLRETLRTTSAVGIVQLFSTARDDVLAEFSLEELQEICRVTEHLRPVYVERIYRAAWDAAMQEADQ